MITPTPNSGEQGEFGDDLSLHVDRVCEGKHGEIHSAKAHRCVDHVQGKGHDESSAWAICTASIGKRGVYSKGHGGSASPKRKVHEGDAPPEGCGLCEACKKNKKRMYERVMEAAVQEVWSDAARAASASARTSRKKGTNWRNAARKTFRDTARKTRYSSKGWLAKSHSQLVAAPVKGMTPGQYKGFKRKTDRHNRIARFK